MLLRRCLLFLVFALLFTFSSSHVLAGTFPRLEKVPLGERWYAVFVSDERTGFAHARTTETQGGYEIYSESGEKMTGFVSREATIRETYTVNRDLTLKSFTVSQVINGNATNLKGDVTPAGVKVAIESNGAKREKFLKHKGVLYPAPALNLYPLLQGIAPGKRYRMSILDAETLKIKEVKTSVVALETFGGLQAIHLRNNRYPFDTDIWVDTAGNTLKESVRDGWIVTMAEDEKAARIFLSEAALARKDLIVNFSLAKVEMPISRPSELRKMAVELSGFPADVRPMSNAVQQAEKLEGGKALFTIDNGLVAAQPAGTAQGLRGLDEYLRPTGRIPSDNPVMIAKKAEIVGAEKDAKKLTGILTHWVASHVKDAVSASPSPLETLQKGGGDCLAHVRLYASLARAAGLPTKLVSGLVYIKNKGFLYHCWAESYIGYWLPVDPTFDEVPANATHIKLGEGDSPDDMAALSKFVGNIRVKVLEQKY